MPIPNSFSNVFDRIESLTKKRKLNWVTGPNKYVFLASFDKASVKVADSGSPDDTEFTFSVINSQGEEIDSFREANGEADFNRLRDLWWDARRIANKVEETLAALESELDKIE